MSSTYRLKIQQPAYSQEDTAPSPGTTSTSKNTNENNDGGFVLILIVIGAIYLIYRDCNYTMLVAMVPGLHLAKAIDRDSMVIVVNNKTPSTFKLGSEHISYGGWKEAEKPYTWQAEITDGVPGFDGYVIYWMD